MPIEITMPRLSDTMEAGTVIKWNVNEGDSVNAGDVVADIETDKATMEMAVYDDGVMARIMIPEGQQVDVGTVIALLAEEDEDPSDVTSDSGAAAPAAEDKSGSADDGPPSNRQLQRSPSHDPSTTWGSRCATTPTLWACRRR